MPISRTTLSVMFLTLLCTLMLLGLSAGQAEPTDKKLEAVVAEEASLSSKRLAQADGAESEAEQQTDDPAKFNREDLRYDNMTFQEWQSRLKTELKSERRVEAVKAMGAFGAKGYAQEAAVAILELMKEYDLSSPVGDLLKDNDLNKVTLAAERALRRIGQPAVPMLVTALKGENRNTRLFVAHTIPRFWGSVPDFIPGLISAAQDPDNYVRREVFAGLDNFAEDNPERLATAADVLVGALNDDDKIVRREAARALQRIAPYAELDALQFIPAMKETALGYSPAAIVGAIDPDPTAVVPLLIDILKDENAEVRLQAIYALGDLGPKARDAVPALIAELRFDDVRTRRSVIHSLGRIGPAANAAVPDLLKALKRGDKDVIGYANEALQKINRSIREPAVVR